MSFNLLMRVAVICAGLCMASAPVPAQSPVHRQIAITIDDLPGWASEFDDCGGNYRDDHEIAGKILREQKIPAVGFVNERKLYKDGEVDARIKALNMWLDNVIRARQSHIWAYIA